MADASDDIPDTGSENLPAESLFGICSGCQDGTSQQMNNQACLAQRQSYIAQKRNQVEEELEHIVSTVQEIIIAKKSLLLQKMDELCHNDNSLEGNVCINSSSRDIENLSTRPGSGRENNGRLVDLNLRVDFEELMNEVRDLSLGDIHAVYDSKGSTVVKKFLNSNDSYEDYIEEVFTGGGVEMKTMCGKVNRDRSDPKLNDIVVVELAEKKRVMVVTDRANNSVKSFYSKKNRPLYSYFQETSSPRGIAQICQNKVAVTVPEGGGIRILQVTPKLKKETLIKTSKGYRGIGALDPNTLVVSTYKVFPGTIDIIDCKGSLLKSLSMNQNGENLFEYPFYLCTTAERQIIVSDCELKHITCLTEEGQPVWILRYGGSSPVTLRYPLGVAVDANGEVLVADCDENKVIRLYENEAAKVIYGSEHGIMGPHGIDVDTEGTIYVAQWNGEIKIFSKSVGHVSPD